jgi:hypothetical protein
VRSRALSAFASRSDVVSRRVTSLITVPEAIRIELIVSSDFESVTTVTSRSAA